MGEYLEQLVSKLVNGMTAKDFNGHYLNGEVFNQDYSRDSLSLSLYTGFHLYSSYSEEDWKQIHEGGTPLETPTTITTLTTKCPICGKRLQFESDGFKLWIASDTCEFSEGLPKVKVPINIPSGRLVLANDLRDWYPTRESNAQGLKENIETTYEAAIAGFGHGYVGNTCPTLFQDETGKMTLGYWDDEVLNEDAEYVPNPNIPNWGKRLGGVCTDLWWFSIADEGDLKKRVEEGLGKIGRDPFQYAEVIDVEPGLYRLTYYPTFNTDLPVVLNAHLERVGKPVFLGKNRIAQSLGQDREEEIRAENKFESLSIEEKAVYQYHLSKLLL